jgi:type II secretory pathway component PulF
MGLSSVLVQHTLGVVVAIIGIFVTVFCLFAHPKAQKYIYALCLKVPIISQIIKQYIWSQTARLIFYYTKSGVSISSACGSVLSLTYLPYRYKKLFTNLVVDIGKGGVLSGILSEYRDIPILWTLYARMGETKVGYSAAFSSITQVHERDMLRRIAYIQKLIEPVLMICIGCIVGIFAYAILLPIYSLVQTLQS